MLVAALVAIGAGVALLVLSRESGPAPGAGAVVRPIDPRQQTAVGFGERSHWLQPWRAYLDTLPATRLRDALGIQFNVEPEEARQAAMLLARSGIRRARVEIGWGELSYNHPDRLKDPGRFDALLGALRDNGIRPLILLNANHQRPGPNKAFQVTVAEPAPQGARRLRLSRESAREVVPRLSGLDSPQFKAAEVIFTQVHADGMVDLSKPLPRPVPAGAHPAHELRYEPFGKPKLESGRPNPAFERTLQGWLEYADTVTSEVERVLGNDDFDVEIWNELTFGADFLYADRYYNPPREAGEGDVTYELPARTVAHLRERLPGSVGIGNGFSSQRPWEAGSTAPAGLTALDKHPYYPLVRFPSGARYNEIEPLDARGRRSFTETEKDGKTVRRDRFVPEYQAFFPEYILNAIQTEHLIRDVSPITTRIENVEHGRSTHPPGQDPPQLWVTETNLHPAGLDPSDPANAGKPSRLEPAPFERLQAKATLRYYTSFVGKGVSALYMYAAKGPEFGLVPNRFFDAARGSGAYPGDAAGGETMAAVRRLSAELRGAESLATTHPLRLLRIADDHGHRQFDGDGTPAHPTLYDRDVVTFFPFQVRDGEYVAASYVMTRNVLDDLDAADFTLTIGGLPGNGVEASATDPLTGDSVDVDVKWLGRGRAELKLPLTDSPRLIRLKSPSS